MTVGSLAIWQETATHEPSIGDALSFEDELVRRGAAVLPHARWSLYEHLIGVRDLLEAWEQPTHVRLAGLAHSVYATDRFTTSLFEASERDVVRRFIGADAERLAFLFGSIPRRDFFTQVRQLVDVRAHLHLLDRTETLCELTPAEIGNLLVLHAANAAEQVCRADGSPAPWLAIVSRHCALAKGRADVPPPIFHRGSVVISDEEERRVLAAYAAVTNCTTEPESDSLGALVACAKELPWVGEPAIVAAALLLALGEFGDARSLVAHGTATLRAWRAPWDKRLSFNHWLRLAQFVRAASGQRAPERTFIASRMQRILRNVGCLPDRILAQLDVLEALQDSGERNVLPSAELKARFSRYIAGFRNNRQRPRMNQYPGLTARPWHDAKSFALVRDLERLAPTIAMELHELKHELFHSESENIQRTGHWDVFMLYERGQRREDNARLCPQTIAAIERHRTVRSLAGLAYFSRLAAGTRVAPHYGPTNLRLRCHLGIDIPDRCGLTVGGETGSWQQGKCIVFDDSFRHEAWNLSDRDRIVLIVDLWHPDLSDDEVELLSGMHEYAVAHGSNLQRYFARNEAARRKTRFD